MKAMSELFALPLAVAPLDERADWGVGIVEPASVDWVAAAAPRLDGGLPPKVIVFAQERAEAIVAAVNERDAMQAEIERLREALQEIAKFDDVLDYKRGWDAAEIAQAALDAGESGA